MPEYEVLISEPVEREITKYLNKELLRRLHKRMDKLKLAPDVYGKPLRAPLAGIWEIRFEIKYRILYIIDYPKKLVTIVGFKHKDEMAK